MQSRSTGTGQASLFEPASSRGSEFDEARLIDKLRAIEALFAGATTSGERDAAEAARQRIRDRLDQMSHEDLPVEYRFSMGDLWSRKVFISLLRRYGVNPYRYRGQRHTTVMARVPKRFVDETLWPEFQKLSATLQAYLSQVTDRVVAQVLHEDSSDADVVSEPPLLPEQSGTPAAEPAAAQQAASMPDAPAAAALENPRKRDKKRKKRRRR